MSRLRCAVRIAPIAALIGLALLANSAMASTARDLARCAGIGAPDARLACYDALAGRSTDRGVATGAIAPTAPAAPASAAAATSTPSTAPTVPAAAPAPAGDPRNFGFTPAQLHTAAPVGPEAVQAHIAQIADRAGRAYVVLDNGQTWTFTDPDEDTRLGPGDSVTIKRASLGSFLMLTPSKRSYHVRRTQ